MAFRMGLREWLLLGSLATLWGASFFFIEVAVRDLPVFTVVTARVGLAAIFLIIFVYMQGHRMPLSLSAWGEFLVLGALRAAFPISLIVWAETQIDSGLASILNSTSPLFTMIVAHFLTGDEKLTINRALGVAISMAGVVVLIGTDAMHGLGLEVLAQVAMLGATLAYGFAAVYGKRMKKYPAAVSSAGMLAGATVLTLPLALVIDQPWHLQPGAASVMAVLGLALLSTALAFIVWFKLIHSAGAANTSMVTFLIPVVGLLLGVGVLGETLAPSSFVGLALILLGLAVSTKVLNFKRDNINDNVPALSPGATSRRRRHRSGANRSSPS